MNYDHLPQIKGICYGPFRAGQSPITKIYPTQKQLEQDLNLINNICSKDALIKTYSTYDALGNVPYMAKKMGFKVLPGCEIIQNKWSNAKEIKNIIKIFNDGISERLVVGDMALSLKKVPLETLIEYLIKVKKATGAKVSSGNHLDAWINNPRLFEYVDFIAVGIFPYIKGVRIDKTLEYLDDQIKKLDKVNVRKLPVIVDSGWPSTGPRVKKAEASIQNHLRYINEFQKYCDEAGIEGLAFEAFDENWKVVYEKEFSVRLGLYTEDRILK